MIHEVEGDILLTGADAIAHGVAANDPMSQGLAKALHERYPAMHKDFHHWCRRRHPKLGSAFLWSGAGHVRLINLLTQEGGYEHGSKPGGASTSSVNHALHALKKVVADEGLESVAPAAARDGSRRTRLERRAAADPQSARRRRCGHLRLRALHAGEQSRRAAPLSPCARVVAR
jgi:O-acetyl-ADP-ribose deacetylase (regulator of RNase III)